MQVAQSMMCCLTSSTMHGISTGGVPAWMSKLFSCTKLNSACLILMLCKTNCLQPMLMTGCHNFSNDTRCPGVTCFGCLANTGPNLLRMSSSGGSLTSKAKRASLYLSSVTWRFGFVLALVVILVVKESTTEEDGDGRTFDANACLDRNGFLQTLTKDTT